MPTNPALGPMACSLSLAASLGCADITTLEDGVRYGSVEVVKDWFTSAALVEAGDTVLLIDAGFRKRAMKRSLDDRGLSPEDVDHVLLTHGHGDHVGALAIYTQAEVWALSEELDLIDEESDDDAPGAQVLDPGSTTFGDIEVEVFSVPGHTPGNAVYLIDETLVLGDTALLDRSGALVPVPEKRSEDPAQAEASLAALALQLHEQEVPITHLVPAHSGGSSNPDLLWAWLP